LTPPQALLIEDHAWGCVVRGTRMQIIAAGIIPLAQWPAFTRDRRTFQAVLPVRDRKREIMIEKDDCPTDTKVGAVWVHYLEQERDCASRVEQALQQLATVQQQIMEIVASVKPVPLSRILAIPGAVVAPQARADGETTD